MSNLLPLDKAIAQAEEAATHYAVELQHMRLSTNRRDRLKAVAQAYSKLSAAQWELEQVLVHTAPARRTVASHS